MLDEIKARNKQIALMSFEGSTTAEIAMKFKLTSVSVNQILRDPLIKSSISSLQDKAQENAIKVRKRISELSMKSLDVMEKFVTPVEEVDEEGNVKTFIPYDQKIQFAAAKDMLDRAGHKPQETRIEISHTLTTDDIAELKQRAAAAGALAPKDTDIVVDSNVVVGQPLEDEDEDEDDS